MKEQITVRLDKEHIALIDQIKKDEALPSRAAVITKFCNLYLSKTLINLNPSALLADAVAQAVEKRLEKILTRIRLGTNNADRNSEVMLLALNHLMYYGVKVPADEETPAMRHYKETVADRIKAFRTKKRERENTAPRPAEEKTKTLFDLPDVAPDDGDLLTEDDLI